MSSALISNSACDGLSWKRMGVDETLVSEVVRRVLTVARPYRIILFGSAATGEMTQDSDIDLLVVEQEPANTRDRSIKIRRALGDVQYPVDVIVMSSERFEETKDIIGGIAYPANKYGRVLYEAVGGAAFCPAISCR
jgi:predicted nucleotidyltransferase